MKTAYNVYIAGGCVTVDAIDEPDAIRAAKLELGLGNSTETARVVEAATDPGVEPGVDPMHTGEDIEPKVLAVNSEEPVPAAELTDEKIEQDKTEKAKAQQRVDDKIDENADDLPPVKSVATSGKADKAEDVPSKSDAKDSKAAIEKAPHAKPDKHTGKGK